MSTIKSSTTLTTAYSVEADTTGALVIQTGATPTTALTISTGQVATFAQAPVLPAASIPQAALAAGVAGNGPAFSVYLGSSQTITSATYTKVQLNTERFDTNNNFDPTTNYRFTPTVAGYYQINYSVYGVATVSMTSIIGALYKNGAVYEYGVIASVTGNQQYSTSTLVSMNGSTDYLELYINVTGTGTVTASAASGTTTYMSGSLVRSA